MNSIFVDTQSFIASFQKIDQWHQQTQEIETKIDGCRLVTTDAVLCELLNYFSGYNEQTREKIARVVHDVLAEDDFLVVEQTRPVFLKALELYESRLDKGSSLTDCISMNVCRELGITEILTHDRHFEQEGFKALL